MTREEYNTLFNRYMAWEPGTRPTDAEYMTAVVALFYENERLQGRIYELEATLDGRG